MIVIEAGFEVKGLGLGAFSVWSLDVYGCSVRTYICIYIYI